MKKPSNDIVEGTRVRVYRNLRRSKVQKIYSVIGPSGKVIAHVSRILLTDVKFVVRPAGREKVRRERRKNVHAFVVGTYSLSGMGTDSCSVDLPVKISYNPYENDTFVGKVVGCPASPVKSASCAIINQHGICAAYTS